MNRVSMNISASSLPGKSAVGNSRKPQAGNGGRETSWRVLERGIFHTGSSNRKGQTRNRNWRTSFLMETWDRDSSSFVYLNLLIEECQAVFSSAAGSSTESELTSALLVTISDQTSSREIFPRFAKPSIKARVERTCV